MQRKCALNKSLGWANENISKGESCCPLNIWVFGVHCRARHHLRIDPVHAVLALNKDFKSAF